MASRVSLPVSSSLLPLQDENKIIKIVTKKPTAARRSVLGDVTNKSRVITKAEQKPTGTGRVPIFGSSKTLLPAATSNVSNISTSSLPISSLSLSSVVPSSSSSVIPSLSLKNQLLSSTSQFKPPPSLKDLNINNPLTAKPHVSLHSSLPPPTTSSTTSALSSSASSLLSSATSSSSSSSVLPSSLCVELAPPEAKPMDIDIADDILEDIDIHDVHDPQCCTEYVQEIFEYCRQKELKDAVSSGYMSRQVDINERMRGILIDWMIEVHVKFKLLTETMFLSVSLIDRFLAQKPIARNKLQLVGITAMFVSAKYEEVCPPEVRDFVHISDNAYPFDEIFKMERLMLTSLDFNLSTPTPLHFLRRFSKAARSDSRTHTLSKYLTELTLVEYKMLDFVPSLIAAASVYLARRMTVRTPYWTSTLEHYTTYSEKKLMECVTALNAIVKKSEKSTLKAVRKKYSAVRLLEVAKIPPVDL